MSTVNTPLNHVKERIKAGGWREALPALNIPEPHGSKLFTCPICGKEDAFRIYDKGEKEGKYICTCGTSGIGFNLLELVARISCGCAADTRPEGSQIKRAAQIIDEACGWGYFKENLTDEQRADMERQRQENQRKYEEDRRKREAEAEETARKSRDEMHRIIAAAAPGECHYLTRKGFQTKEQPLSVTADGTGIAPIHNIDGELVNIQRLLAKPLADGRTKDPMAGLPTSGMFIPVHTPEPASNTLIIAEGYATALSVSIITPSCRVIAALYAANLKKVAALFRERFPALEIVIAADHDPKTATQEMAGKKNTGLIAAIEAAKLVDGLVVAPLGDKKQDWNDMHQSLGVENVAERFNRELAKARNEKASREEANSDAVTANSDGDNINTDQYSKRKIAIVPAGTNIRLGVSNDYEKYGPWRDTMPQEWASQKAPYICQHWLSPLDKKQRLAFIFHEPSVRGKEDEKEIKDCNSTVLCVGVRLSGRGWLENEACLTLESALGHRFSFKASELNPKNLRAILSNMGGEPDQGAKGMEALATLFSWMPCPAFTYSMLPGWYRLPDVNGAERYNYTSLNGKTYGYGKDTHSAMLTLPTETSAFSVAALKQWQEGVAALAIGNPIMVFTILYALAAPFYRMATEKTKAEMPIIHIFGTTTQGKTTALKGAASVLGKPDRAMYGWSATAYGLTQLATAMNNGLLILDELQLAGTGDSSEGSKLSKAFRELSEGAGKIQGKPIGYGFIRTPRFETAILSSGELSAESFIESKGGDTSGGVGARLLDIPFIPYSDIHEYPDTKAFVEAYEAAAAKSNGAALDAVLTELCAMDTTTLREKISEGVGDFSAWMAGVTNDPVVTRALAKLAPIYAIGLMTMHVTGFSEDDIVNTFAALVGTYADYNGTGNRDERKFLEALHDAIVANRAHIQPRNISDGAESRYISCEKGFFETKKASSDEDDNETYPIWLLRPSFIREVMPAMDYMKKINALRNAGRFEWHENVLNGDKPETAENATRLVKVRTGLKEGTTPVRLVSISGHGGFGS